MRCDVLAVGTELLLGQIIDSNSAWIGGELAASGIDSLVQVKVGDNVGRIEAQLSRMLVDADAVIMCGGLGPTHDDLTRHAIANVMGVELVEDAMLVDTIRQMFESRGRTMAENNRRQAEVPVGAAIISQTRGTAPGLICPVTVDGVDKVVYAVPGVPHEMRDMLERAIIPDLLERSGETAVIASRVLRTWGESESGLNEKLEHVIEQLETPDTPTLAFLASGWNGLKVRLTAKDATRDGCSAQLDQWEAVVRHEIDDLIFGTDDDTMESVVLDLCRQRGLTLAVAESVTGGLVGGRLTDIPGSSDVFRGGVISYATEVKQTLLGVGEGPVVSEIAARQMAVGVRDRLGADIGLSLTGVAGPAEQDGQPVGTLFVGMVGPGFEEVRQANMPGLRELMRQFSVITALGFLRQHLI
ncbi:MAG: competence/damage-inducible protein A [Ilumatobacter sp.]|jgi:nicotinamide-nucleotide amidase|uniref:competence/damage-inducible protein A n=1 Tax=Ilumatobacter sp. TaxID=1967498 RepID=UPI001DC7EA75|nr:competence/damage-inducible protein A [Ilumatobacter sp.]MBT5277546.1 competence/damage-inducible protein A [Ilumatobacter sp.]MBT5553932.1 competence/damage-inducible protein A [Ilumatobacter sp.]MBT5866779.1 competence/damage-inducible protein A [Ilumatobacter sp.]MDG0977538.1 competence/damage-inducible protein A [Ilumatobacter sp.]